MRTGGPVNISTRRPLGATECTERVLLRPTQKVSLNPVTLRDPRVEMFCWLLQPGLSRDQTTRFSNRPGTNTTFFGVVVTNFATEGSAIAAARAASCVTSRATMIVP